MYKILLFLIKLILIVSIILIYIQLTKEKSENKFNDLLINKNKFLSSINKFILILFIINCILHIIIFIF